MTNRIEKFKKMKAKGLFEKQEMTFFSAKSEDLTLQSSSFLSDEMDLSVEVNYEDANILINEIKESWEKEKFNDVIYSCKKDAMHSVISAFGLGSVLAAYDKKGGNVTTVHNAKQDIYAKEEQEYVRGKYTGSGSAYKKNYKNYRDSQINSDFTIKDEYTGKTLNYKDEKNRSSVDVDHIKSVKTYHQEGGFIQTKEQQQAFAGDQGNFAVTDKSINRSMKAKDIIEWGKQPNKNDPTKTNAEYHEINQKKLNETLKRSQDTVKTHAPKTKEWIKYYTDEISKTGIKEAGKMGTQMAIGLLLTNFFEALFEEVKDAYENGFIEGTNEDKFFKALKIRLSRVAQHILKDWKQVIVTFKDGAIAGFLSNLLTVAINTVFTTATRLVRMIREGVMSLVKAVKIILFRPKGMSKEETYDAAIKLIATGVVISVGIIAEEAISTSITGVPFAEMITVALTTSLVAIGTSMVIYGLDKLDLFGINENKRHKFTMQQLEQKLQIADEKFNKLYDEAINPFGVLV